ncbi:MAG: hypothetical protein HUJ24_05495 [Rhodobacteraceae bacterium]|nr:hypothetical protein [Paracoccaceae bacterium]
MRMPFSMPFSPTRWLERRLARRKPPRAIARRPELPPYYEAMVRRAC